MGGGDKLQPHRRQIAEKQLLLLLLLVPLAWVG
jgi:hypothetical protein